MPAQPVVTWPSRWETFIGHPGHHALPEPVTAHRACWPTVVHRRTGEVSEVAGACLGCGWIGAPRRAGADGIGRVPLAVADAHDHSHPAWRTVPAVGPRRPGWADQVRRAYPAGWWETGGPVVMTEGAGGLHVRPGEALDRRGGYALAAVLRGETTPRRAADEVEQGRLF